MPLELIIFLTIIFTICIILICLLSAQENSKLEWLSNKILLLSFLVIPILIASFWIYYAYSFDKIYKNESVKELISIEGKQFLYLGDMYSFTKGKKNPDYVDSGFINMNLMKGKYYKDNTKFLVKVPNTLYAGIDFCHFMTNPLEIEEIIEK